MFVIENNVFVVIASPVLVSDTSIVVTKAAAPLNNPPNPSGGISILTLTDNPTNPSKIEVITYTGITDNGATLTLTGVSRAQEGTTAQSWSINDKALQSQTKGIIAALQSRANHTGTQTLATISDAGTAAAQNVEAFATAAQGATADTALQPGAIGSTVQAFDAGLTSIAGLTTAADRMIYTIASDTYAVSALTSYARTLLDDADAASARSTLELGTAATTAATDYATAAQGATADSALQPNTAITVTTIDTGQGAVECYAMDQATRTTDSVTFGTLTVTGTATFADATLDTHGLTRGQLLNFIGTDDDQVPLNQYLGSMAYQDADAATVGQIDVDNIRIDGNTISSTNTNGNITIDPNGTGMVSIPSAVTITGTITSSVDSSFNGVNVGRGGGSISSNTGVGFGALGANVSGSAITAVGLNALNACTGSNNTAIGNQAGLSNTTGTNNVFCGRNAGVYQTTGSNSLYIGAEAGQRTASGDNNTAASDSIFIGRDARPDDISQVNQIVVGKDAIGNGSNTVTIGNSSIVSNHFTGRLLTSESIKPGTYTVATAPSAATHGAGATLYFSDGAAGSPVLAFSDGTNWLRCDTLTTISDT